MAKEYSEKHQPIWLEAKHTLPSSGERRNFELPLGHLLNKVNDHCGNRPPDDGVDLFDGVPQLEVRVVGRQLQLEDQPINLVDHQSHRQIFTDGMLHQVFGIAHDLKQIRHAHLKTYSLDCINNQHHTIGQPERGSDLIREVDMA